MATNFNKYTRQDDIKFLTRVIIAFLFIVWLCTPPGNKFLQICFWGNNTQLAIAKLTNKAETTEYIYHRKNAIYYTKINDKRLAFKSIDKAIATVPNYISESIILDLYKDRALISIYFKEHQIALNDLLRLKGLDVYDNLRIAMLLKEKGQLNMALSYCNNILALNTSNYSAYSCMADVYAAAGRYDTSIKLFDLFMQNSRNVGTYYVERAYYKEKAGDFIGAEEDKNAARQLNVNPDDCQFIVNKVLTPESVRFKS